MRFQAIDPPVPHHAEQHRSTGDDALVAGLCVLGGNGADATVAGGATSFLALLTGNQSATEGVVQLPMPFLGVLRRLRLVTGSAQPAGGGLVVTVRVNGVDTTLTATVAAAAGAGTVTDLVNGVLVKPGDLVAIELTNGAAGASASVRGFSLELRAR